MRPDADQADGDGPDGSSLRPVSSLRARFENMNKPGDAPTSDQKPPSRPISPAPKPDKLREFKLNNLDITSTTPTATAPSSPVVPAWVKERPKPGPVPPAAAETPAANILVPPPRPSSTKPILNPKPAALAATPAVVLQPPQSPPKERSPGIFAGAPSNLLNPDLAAALSTPTTPSKPGTASPVRSTSPAPAPPPPRSPRAAARPPSPPAPRRSGELKRDGKSAPPPPAPRRDRSLVNEPLTVQTSNVAKKVDVSEENSPFSSPPTSPGTDHDEPPPQLPTRPRPQSMQVQPTRPKASLAGFQPPPVHHSIANRRNIRPPEAYDTAARGRSFDEPRPMAPPTRQQTTDMKYARNLPVQQAQAAPPRPPRPNGPISSQNVDAVVSAGPTKRITSNPTQATQQLAVVPTRTHDRSKTMDGHSSNRAVSGQPPAAVTAAAAAPKPAVAQSATPKPEPVTTYPDVSSTNRRPPYMKKAASDIQTRYDPRIFDVCGDLICTSGQITRIWSITDGELLMSLPTPEGIKIISVAFKPAATPEEEGTKVWLGTSFGELMEVDVLMHTVTNSKSAVHGRHEVIRIHRHRDELWTIDELGNLLVWGPDETGVPNVEGNPSQIYKLPKAHTFSMVVGNELWHATGKEIRVFAPTLDGRVQFQVLIRPLIADGAGEVTSGTLIRTQPGKVFFGHSDGKISIYSTKDYSSLGVLNISTWKMNSIVGVGHRLWVGYNTGKICVYDISDTPWTVLKEWQAHGLQNPVISMKADHAGSYRLDRVQVVSLGADNKLRTWDGLLEDDWIEDEMKSRDTTYCDFDELKALVFTWNAGASTPHSLRYSGNDGNFFPGLIQSSGSPDILIFGFQELVDLEDKTATAKRFLKSKKKSEGAEQERMSHQYRDWRDFLIKTLDDYIPSDDLYHLLHTAPLVGLFTCVFVKASLRPRIRALNGAEVKRGMGGLHGNKGAVAVRFQIDDSTLCFVNCHLAAGQSQAAARHNDVAEILDQYIFPPEQDHDALIDSFAGGGDGSSVLDHELCILNGDLNYRIDTMSRDTVVMAVKQNNLSKLLERDQLLVARRRNHAFRLRAFEELPITFAPTYKYDVGTDNYDTSEKRRSPAWCDRVLFRGRGRVQQLDYRRHEVRTSDHRPVTASFKLWVKKVRPGDRAKALMESQRSFETARVRETADEKLYYLMQVCGYDENTSKRYIAEKASR